MGRDSTVGTATRYGLVDPGIDFRLQRDGPHPIRPALGSTQILGLFPGDKKAGTWR